MPSIASPVNRQELLTPRKKIHRRTDGNIDDHSHEHFRDAERNHKDEGIQLFLPKHRFLRPFPLPGQHTGFVEAVL